MTPTYRSTWRPGLGDTIEHHVLVSLPAAYLTGYIVTLVTANNIATY